MQVSVPYTAKTNERNASGWLCAFFVYPRKEIRTIDEVGVGAKWDRGEGLAIRLMMA